MTRPHPHRLRRVTRAVVVALGLALGVMAMGGAASPAHADPLSDKKAEAQTIASKIYDLNIQLEQLAEAANGAQVELDRLIAQADVAKSELEAAQIKRAQHRNELRTYAISAYVNGDLPTDLEPQDPSVSAVDARYGYLQAAADNRQQLIDQLTASEAVVTARLSELKTAQDAAAVKADDLKERQSAAQAIVDEQQQLKSRIDAELGALVKQAELDRRAAEREAAREAQQREAAAPKPDTPTTSIPPQSGGTPPTTVPIPNRPIPPGPIPAPYEEGAAKAIEYARAQLGKPYLWGGEGPNSFDCSGLTMQAWRAGGVKLDHWTGSQYARTRPIPLTEVQPGDLVFYNGQQHVALYIGNGKIIHAPRAGSVVEIEDMYFWRTDMTATRPLP